MTKPTPKKWNLGELQKIFDANAAGLRLIAEAHQEIQWPQEQFRLRAPRPLNGRPGKLKRKSSHDAADR